MAFKREWQFDAKRPDKILSPRADRADDFVGGHSRAIRQESARRFSGAHVNLNDGSLLKKLGALSAGCISEGDSRIVRDRVPRIRFPYRDSNVFSLQIRDDP